MAWQGDILWMWYYPGLSVSLLTGPVWGLPRITACVVPQCRDEAKWRHYMYIEHDLCMEISPLVSSFSQAFTEILKEKTRPYPKYIHVRIVSTGSSKSLTSHHLKLHNWAIAAEKKNTRKLYMYKFNHWSGNYFSKLRTFLLTPHKHCSAFQPFTYRYDKCSIMCAVALTWHILWGKCYIIYLYWLLTSHKIFVQLSNSQLDVYSVQEYPQWGAHGCDIKASVLCQGLCSNI